MVKRILFLAIAAWVSVTVHAAPIAVKGTITDASDQLPLAGAVVTVKGSANGVAAGATGVYVLKNVEPTDTLVVTCLGYISQNIPVAGRTTLNVALLREAITVDDVVVVGYGTVRKGDLTGTVGQVNMKDISRAPVGSFSDALAGRIAGVQVSSNDGQPGEAANIVIRGGNSLTQSNAPLYVIDGFPMEAEDVTINSDDIESITTLMDASATAIYGARGANGVLVIETKKGKVGRPEITFNASAGVHQMTKKMELLSPYEYLQYQNELIPDKIANIYFTDGKTIENYRNVTGYDWQDLITQNALTQNYSIAIRGGRGGDRETRYSISGSLYDQQGIVIASGYSRAQGRFSFEQSLNSKVKVGINANYGSRKKTGQPIAIGDDGSASSTIFYSVWGARPITGKEENLEEELIDPDAYSDSDMRVNPVMNAKNSYMVTTRNDLMANAYLDYKIIPELTFKTKVAYKKVIERSDRFYNSNSSRGSSLNPNNTKGVNGSVQYQETGEWLNENTLNYRKFINKHNLVDALVGFTLQETSIDNFGYAAQYVPDELLGMSGLDDGTPYEGIALLASNRMMGFLGRVQFSHRSKYTAMVSIRADGSSKFPKNGRWGYFPSASVAWTISREPFMKSLKFLSDLKLKASYGATGNNRVGSFSYLHGYEIDNYQGYSFNNSTPMPISLSSNMGNPELKWETTYQANVGLDFGLFNGRISGNAAVYRKNTKDLLLNASIPYTSGYPTVYKNIGEVQNQGLEVTINTVNINTRRFTWTSNFNIAFNQNKIVSLAEGETNRLSSIRWEYAYNTTPLYIAQVGKSAALFYGYVFDGLYQLSDFSQTSGKYTLLSHVPNNGNVRSAISPGDVKYKDLNGDGVVDANDQTIIGNPQPLHTGGFTNNFAYAGFSLNIFLQWSYGGEIYNANRIIFEGERSRSLLNQYASVLDRWTPTNPSNTIPRPGGGATVGTYSSRVIEDGSFLRLKTVSLAYTLPNSITSRMGMRSMVVDLSAQNIYTWTNYSGMDPEVSIRNSILTPGFDFAPYPRAFTVVLGVKITL